MKLRMLAEHLDRLHRTVGPQRPRSAGQGVLDSSHFKFEYASSVVMKEGDMCTCGGVFGVPVGAGYPGQEDET